jgi:P27 family predicted phage terminase small subunit
MSQAGRPRLPSFVKELHGTLQAADIGEPQPEAALYIPPPRELAERPYAQEFWEVHLPLLVKNRMITEVDMTAFAVACLSYEAWISAENQLALPAEQGGGQVVKTKNGYEVQSAWVSIAAQRRKEFTDFLREFGMTPSARTRIRIQLLGAPGDGVRDVDQGFFDF